MRGYVDQLQGVTENIIVGQPIRMGTGDVHLISRKAEKVVEVPPEIETAEEIEVEEG